MALESQIQIFEEAKQSIAHELKAEVFAWDFSAMLSHWKAVIEDIRLNQKTGRNPMRFFARHYLDLRGQSPKEMRDWLGEKAVMPLGKIQLLLRFLNGWNGQRASAAPAPKKKKGRARPRKRESKPEPVTPKTTGMIRELVVHTTTIFNSAMILVLEAGVNPSDLFDGDRIQIRIALKKICDAFGIDVNFPEPETVRNKPITRRDLADLGLPQPKRRKNDVL